MFRRKRRMGLTALLTVAYWLMLAPAAWLLARGMGLDLPLHLILFIPPILFAVVVLPREGIGVLQSWRRIAGRQGE